MRKPGLLGLLVLTGFTVAGQDANHHGNNDGKNDAGFSDTPLLPGLPYHVHDPLRPHPRVVMPGALPGQPPSDAIILFDGTGLSKWTAARLGSATYTVSSHAAPWKAGRGYFEVAPGSGDIATKEKFGDVQLHVE